MDRLVEESKERDDHLLFLGQMLNTKIDAVESRLGARMDGLDQKIDAVAADFLAHRRDTEAHGGGVYRVKEGT